jgi:hypothetical protein
VLSIVLPAAAAPATGLLRRTIADVLSVTVSNEIVSIIYIYIIVAAPSGVATPAAAPGSAHRYANAE